MQAELLGHTVLSGDERSKERGNSVVNGQTFLKNNGEQEMHYWNGQDSKG